MKKIKRVFRLVLIVFPLAILLLLAARVSDGRRLPESLPNATLTVSPYADFTVHIPQKALLKNYLTVSAEAAPGTVCRLIYVPPSGESLQMETISDSNGLCEWRWKIEESHRAGDARLIFTINGSSDTHFIQIFKEF
jgi:hypothetical protein